MQLEELYARYRGLLFRICYEIVGSVAEAEDLAQDVFVTLQTAMPEGVANWKAYLARMATNRSLNALQSARARREAYVGPWLPEPLLRDEAREPDAAAESADGVSYAARVLLHRLSPVERAAFLLREAFGFSYAELADILGKTEPACRQLVSRAKRKLQPLPEPHARVDEQSEAWARSFLTAAREGRFGPLLSRLREDIVLYTDGGGKSRAALRPIEGAGRVTAFLEGIARKGSLAGDWRLAVLDNGERSLLLKSRKGERYWIGFGTDAAGRLAQLFIIKNPDKLARCHI